MSQVTCYRHKSCYLCGGARFFELKNGRHYPCPVCKMDGAVLTADGEPPPIPSRLVRTIVDGIKGGLGPE